MIAKNILSHLMVLVTFVKIAHFLKSTSYEVVRLDCEGDPQWTTNISCSLKSYNRSYRTITVKGMTIQPENEVYLNIQIYRKPLLSPGAYLKIIDETVDVCKAYRNGYLGPVIELFIKAIIQYAYLPTSCPVLANQFVGFIDFEYNTRLQKYVPSFVVNGRYRLQFKTFYENITYFMTSIEALARVNGILDGN